MQEKKINSEEFTENDSLKVIKEMISVSQRKMENNGLLFILWGWVMFIFYLVNYLTEVCIVTYRMEQIPRWIALILILVILAYTLRKTVFRKTGMTSHIDISLRFVWFTIFASMIVVNLILFNGKHEIDFTLQNPLFMVLISIALVISGGIAKFRVLIVAGLIFAGSAYLCSHLDMNPQLLIEAFAYLICLAIPGHILYSRRNN